MHLSTGCRPVLWFWLRSGLLTILLLSASASISAAATKTETRTATTSQDVTFRGVGCSALSERTISLPLGARDVTPVAPEQSVLLISSTTDEAVATVQAIDVDGRRVRWSVVGTDSACDQGAETLEWEAEATLQVRYQRRVKVLTRATVVRRGDRICRSYSRKYRKVEARFDRLSDNDLDGMVRALRDLAQIFRGMNRRLGDLAVPTERRSSFVGYRRAIDRAQQRIDAAADAAKDYNIGGMEFQVRKLGFAASDARRHGARYGFHQCGAKMSTG